MTYDLTNPGEQRRDQTTASRDRNENPWVDLDKDRTPIMATRLLELESYYGFCKVPWESGQLRACADRRRIAVEPADVVGGHYLPSNGRGG